MYSVPLGSYLHTVNISIRNLQPHIALPADLPLDFPDKALSDHPMDSSLSDLRRHSRLASSHLTFLFGSRLLSAIPYNAAWQPVLHSHTLRTSRLRRNHYAYCVLQPDSAQISGRYSGHSIHGILVSCLLLVFTCTIYDRHFRMTVLLENRNCASYSSCITSCSCRYLGYIIKYTH
jgi:hypothetical protein